MQQLMAEGSYFSEEEMKIRCVRVWFFYYWMYCFYWLQCFQNSAPWLYDQFVGKYETDSEIKQRIDDITRGTWSGQLMQHAASAAAR